MPSLLADISSTDPRYPTSMASASLYQKKANKNDQQISSFNPTKSLLSMSSFGFLASTSCGGWILQDQTEKVSEGSGNTVISPAPPYQRTLSDGVFATAEPPRKHAQDHIHANNMSPYSFHDTGTCLIRCNWVGLTVH